MDSLQLLYQSDEIEYPNGIAINNTNTSLYIASATKGIRIIDLNSISLVNDPDTSGTTTGIDGLEYHRGALYAIQNGLPIDLHNFRKLNLDKNEHNVLSAEVLLAHTSDLNVPLTFCITPDDRAVVIGNSNLQYLDQVNLTFDKPESLQKTKLLIFDLHE